MRPRGPARYAPMMDQEASAPEPDQPEEQDWAAYYRYTLGREPRPLFLRGMVAMEEAARAPGSRSTSGSATARRRCACSTPGGG